MLEDIICLLGERFGQTDPHMLMSTQEHHLLGQFPSRSDPR
jgi:hypothetical protein